MPFKYFLTYKLSQDHLELFFSKIRSCGGFNNNPSVVQFQAAFRSLVLKNCVTPSLAGNCMALDDDDGYIAITRKSRTSLVDNADTVAVDMYVNAVGWSIILCKILKFIKIYLHKFKYVLSDVV